MHTIPDRQSPILVCSSLLLCHHRAPCATPLRPVSCGSVGSAAVVFMPGASRRGHKIFAIPSTTKPQPYTLLRDGARAAVARAAPACGLI